MVISLDWQNFNWVDYSIVALIVLSILISAVRGFVRESIALMAWILAFVLSLLFTSKLSESAWVSHLIQSPLLRRVLIFLVLFLGVLILGALFNHLIGKCITKIGLGTVDKFLGVFFGLARGLLIVAVVILFGQLTVFQKDSGWTDSKIIPQLQPVVDWLRDTFPEPVDKLESFVKNKTSVEGQTSDQVSSPEQEEA